MITHQWVFIILIYFLYDILAYNSAEEYWQKMTKMCLSSFDDQGKLNCGLKGLNVQWLNTDSDFTDSIIRGITDNGMHISVLPYNHVCRLDMCQLEKRETLYIWHKGGKLRTMSEKMNGARVGRTWFLKDGWQYLHMSRKREDWLNSIANKTVLS